MIWRDNFGATLAMEPAERGRAISGGAEGPRAEPLSPLLFGIVAALLFAGLGTTFYLRQLHGLNQALDRTMLEDQRAAAELARLVKAAGGERIALNETLDAADAPGRDASLLEYERAAGEFGRAAKRLASLAMTSTEARTLASRRRLLDDVGGHFEQVASLAKSGAHGPARVLLHSVAMPSQDMMQDAMMQWGEAYQARHRDLLEQIRRQRERVMEAFPAVVMASGVLGLLLAIAKRFWNGRVLRRPSRTPQGALVGHWANGMIQGVDHSLGCVIRDLTRLNRYRSVVGAVLAGYRQLENKLTEEDRNTIVALREKLELDSVMEEARTLLRASAHGAKEARKGVWDLYDVSGLDEHEASEQADVNQCMDTALGFLGSRLAGGVSLRREFGRLPNVACSPAALSQVFITLIGSILDALRDRGSVTVRSGLADGYVRVEIKGVAEIEQNGGGRGSDSSVAAEEEYGATLRAAFAAVQNQGGELTVGRDRTQPVFRISLPLRQGAARTRVEKANPAWGAACAGTRARIKRERRRSASDEPGRRG